MNWTMIIYGVLGVSFLSYMIASRSYNKLASAPISLGKADNMTTSILKWFVTLTVVSSLFGDWIETKFYISDISISADPLDVSGGSPVIYQNLLWYLSMSYYWIFILLSLGLWWKKLFRSTVYKWIIAVLVLFTLIIPLAVQKTVAMGSQEISLLGHDTYFIYIDFITVGIIFLGAACLSFFLLWRLNSNR